MITIGVLEAAWIFCFSNEQQGELYFTRACIDGDPFLLCLASISGLLKVGSQGFLWEKLVLQASLITVKNLVKTVATIPDEDLKLGDALISSCFVC